MNKNKKTGDSYEVDTLGSNKPHHGYNVKQFRKMRGFSQEYMAAKLGILQPRFSELERQAVIDDEMLNKIAEVLELNVVYLKDVVFPPAQTSYTQTGENGILNSCNENLEVNQSNTINNPIETAPYTITIEELKKQVEDYRKLAQSLSDKNDQLVQQVIDFSNNIKSNVLNTK